MNKSQYIYIYITDIDTGEVFTGDDVLISGDGTPCLNESQTMQGNYRVHLIVQPTEESEVERTFVWSVFNKGFERRIEE